MKVICTHTLLIPLAVSLAAHSAVLLSLRHDRLASRLDRPAPHVSITWRQEPGMVPPPVPVGEEFRLRDQDQVNGPQTVPGIESSAGEFSRNIRPALGPIAQARVRGADQESMLRYQDTVKRRLEALRNYPAPAWRRRLQGETLVRFVVLPDGACPEVEVVRSSGTGLLDQAAVETVRRASPFPPFPAHVIQDRMVMRVALIFKLD